MSDTKKTDVPRLKQMLHEGGEMYATLQILNSNVLPCTCPKDGKACVARERERKDPKTGCMVSFLNYRVEKMCEACAAYWYVSCGQSMIYMAIKRAEAYDE